MLTQDNQPKIMNLKQKYNYSLFLHSIQLRPMTWKIIVVIQLQKHLMTNIRKTHPLFKIINHSFIDLPAPSNISSWWNFGSLLGVCLIVQIITGLFLAIHYTSDTITAFSSVTHICRDVNYGWLIRYIHANGASIFFICLFLHVGRGLYYGSYTFIETWNIGVLLLFAVIATAFIGYVLPWGHIILWCHSYYKPPISHPIYWNNPSRMNLRGLLSRQSHLDPILRFPLHLTIYYRGPSNRSPPLPPRNRIKQPNRIKLRCR